MDSNMTTDVGYSKHVDAPTGFWDCSRDLSEDHMRDIQREDREKRWTIALRRRDFETLTAERSFRYRQNAVTGMSQPVPRQVWFHFYMKTTFRKDWNNKFALMLLLSLLKKYNNWLNSRLQHCAQPRWCCLIKYILIYIYIYIYMCVYMYT